MIKTCGHLILVAAVMTYLTGCGTLLHPERRGQKGGSIDAGIAILDGLGLLVFLIPGIIAFAVDFSNGTIYLPSTPMHASSAGEAVKQIAFEPKNCNDACIEHILLKETGQHVHLRQANVKIARSNNLKDMAHKLAEADTEVQNARVSLR
jgi:hypothetical protein